jgi:hypothetical protein
MTTDSNPNLKVHSSLDCQGMAIDKILVKDLSLRLLILLALVATVRGTMQVILHVQTTGNHALEMEQWSK